MYFEIANKIVWNILNDLVATFISNIQKYNHGLLQLLTTLKKSILNVEKYHAFSDLEQAQNLLKM